MGGCNQYLQIDDVTVIWIAGLRSIDILACILKIPYPKITVRQLARNGDTASASSDGRLICVDGLTDTVTAAFQETCQEVCVPDFAKATNLLDLPIKLAQVR